MWLVTFFYVDQTETKRAAVHNYQQVVEYVTAHTTDSFLWGPTIQKITIDHMEDSQKKK